MKKKTNLAFIDSLLIIMLRNFKNIKSQTNLKSTCPVDSTAIAEIPKAMIVQILKSIERHQCNHGRNKRFNSQPNADATTLLIETPK